MSTAPTFQGERVVLEPVEEIHLLALRRILATPEVRSRWGDEAASPDWPFDDGEEVRFAIIVEGEVRGMVQYGEENTPMYRHASIDIFVDPAVHRQGIGHDAVRTIARHLIVDLGHHRIVIDPAADNRAAIRCYESVGFRPVGIMRKYEHDVDGDGWHDGLLMDLLADDFDQGPSPARP
ncbi:MAG: GNAT family N-acetyltransferase [Acidimicrobiaceae bacterium]|nr:GNAT family N-acetyltransferase [Acidimicrobiaceae bacterium]